MKTEVSCPVSGEPSEAKVFGVGPVRVPAPVLLALLVIAGLTACSTAEHEDLRAWMLEEAKGMKGRVPPLPEIKPFPVVSYEGEVLLSPFSVAKILTAESSKDQTAPDSERPRQPLESFPIEDLRLTGVIFDGKQHVAIINTPAPNKPKHVRVGEFMGQNFGKVIAIDQDGIKVAETVKDSNGAWTDREVTIQVPRQGGRK